MASVFTLVPPLDNAVTLREVWQASFRYASYSSLDLFHKHCHFSRRAHPELALLKLRLPSRTAVAADAYFTR